MGLGRKGNQMTKDFLESRCKKIPNGCWEWTGTVTKNGYGQVSFKQKKYRPHRVAMHLWHGSDLDSELLVCHKCDNKLCCNPEHLFAGTGSDNMRDCRDKGRLHNQVGSNHNLSKIDEDDVLFILELFKSGWTQPTIAEIFPVNYGTIKNICQGKSWKHVDRKNYANIRPD